MTTTSKMTHPGSETEQVFRQNEQRYPPLIENTSDIIALINAEGIVTYVDPSITAMLGYTPEEIVGCHVFVLIHPDDLDIMQRMLGEIRQTPGRSLSAAYRLNCKDGSWRWFEGSSTNLLHVPGVEAIVSTFRAITKPKLMPHSHWSEISASEHFVQFCETDAFLMNSLSEFIGSGLKEGEVCIVVATQPHRESLEERLQADGLEVAAARVRGQYLSLDAAATLSQFMVDGSPEPGRFAEVVGNMIARAANGRSRVRIFGEMVALLWADGNRAAAIRLEELWNDLGKTHCFSLFCAYPMQGFGGEVYEVEFTEICQQHSQVIPSESYTALDDPQERLRAITLLQQKAHSLEAEIAERKRAEERLRISENRYRRLFEASKDGILIVDPGTGIITDANPSMTGLLGYTHEQLLGQDLWHIGLLKDREATLEVLRELQEQHVLRYETLLLQSTEGQRRALELVCNLYQENGHEVIQCNIRDITERKELERRKDEFISMASHELKTPVTSLKGFLGLLQRRLTIREDEKALHYLARMDAQVNKLTKLINDLLDLSKMQTGQLAYREERFEVDALVQEIVENVQGTTQTHHLLLEGQSRAEVFGDRDRIGQVMINLLNNAIKYSPQADSVLVRVAKDHNKVLLSVQDFGIGIAKEHRHRIFERFYQVTGPEEKNYPGLGIGLYISCEIVRRHGGQLWVESKKGEGATFHFMLPLA